MVTVEAVTRPIVGHRVPTVVMHAVGDTVTGRDVVQLVDAVAVVLISTPFILNRS